MTSAQQGHDPSLGTAPGNPIAHNSSVTEVPQLNLANLGQEQVMQLLKVIPGVFNRLGQGDLKDSAAAEALSNLSQAGFAAQQAQQHHLQHPAQAPYPGQHIMADPGPSSHPRGPPNLGQLAAASVLQSPPTSQMRSHSQEGDMDGQHDASAGPSGGEDSPDKNKGGRRGGRSATMSNDEWTRQRKDNHKEVERRRRGNINEGINELGRIVPNGSGEKAKGAILSRAVQYIHHLKENEARNIEKWTLEKLLMDQAMGDLQAQLEEMRRLWDEERSARQRAESELDVLRGIQQGQMGVGKSGEGAEPRNPDGLEKRGREEAEGAGAELGKAGEEDRSKRKRTE